MPGEQGGHEIGLSEPIQRLGWKQKDWFHDRNPAHVWPDDNVPILSEEKCLTTFLLIARKNSLHDDHRNSDTSFRQSFEFDQLFGNSDSDPILKD
ncbi:hypothetical protein TNCV_2327561 [Trichonephila clavipes]|nr:hypothetical protein TNCV_2327561 [Trichonephila clavipes]